MAKYEISESYLKNQNLPNKNYLHKYTQKELDEFVKCMHDPVYFIRTYTTVIHVDKGVVPFNLYDYQENIVKACHENRFVICKMARQSGKAIHINTPILTANKGLITLENLQVGDKVYGQDGKETTVTFITETMYNHKCYDIEFDDGTIVTADAEHLWKVNSAGWWKENKILTTEQIIDYMNMKCRPENPIYIDINDSLIFPEKNLPIDPYTLGVWLGDGNSRDARITCHHEDYEGYKTNLNETITEWRSTSRGFKIEGLHVRLRKNNLLNNKHIPRDYIYNSINNRLEFVRGLMDTDGYVNIKGICEFIQKNQSIRDNLHFILRSLGIKSRKFIKRHTNGNHYYGLRFATTKFEVFKLPRKIERQKNCKNHPKNSRIYIKSIKEVPSVPVKCIQVDNEDHMFLCHENLIPTHNSTTILAYLLHYILFNDHVNVAVLANKGDTARELLARLAMAFEYLPRFLQQGIVTWNKGSIEFTNGSRIKAAATSSSGLRGHSYNCILLDEFAHIEENIAEAFFASTFPTISSGKSTKVIIVSTPLGLNLFHKMWVGANLPKGDPLKNEYVPIEVHWSQVPGRDEEWKRQMIINTNEIQFAQEHECISQDTEIIIKNENGENFKIPIGEAYKLMNQREYCIYKITRDDGLQYIGTTYFDRIKTRMQHHSYTKRFKGYKFTYEILERSYDHRLLQKEEFYISTFDTFHNGLNSSINGKGNHLCEKFTTLGYNHSEETKRKIGEKSKLKTPWNLGKKYKILNGNNRKGKRFSSKLDKEKVREIIQIYFRRPPVQNFGLIMPNGKIMSYIQAFALEIGPKYSVTPNNIKRIINQETWKDVWSEFE